MSLIQKVFPETRATLANFEKELTAHAYTDEIRESYVDQVSKLRTQIREEQKIERQETNGDTRWRATAVHWILAKRKISQVAACGLMGIDPKTYRRQLNKREILSDDDFFREAGISIGDYVRKEERSA